MLTRLKLSSIRVGESIGDNWKSAAVDQLLIAGGDTGTPVLNTLLTYRMVQPRSLCSLVLLTLACLQAVAVPQADGPYILRRADGGWEAWSVEAAASGFEKRVEPLRRRARITVPSVGSAPAFEVRLRAPAAVSPDVLATEPDAPLFVVADTHGEFEILASMLRAHGIVDEHLKWRFGRGHLILLGDVFDRGPNHTEILWLVYQLEVEANKAGGGVHLVLGNHEVMVLRGDLRYLNSKYSQTAELLGVRSYADLFSSQSVLGQWLRTKPAMLKINDLLCLHGGISRELMDRKLTLADINTTVRAVLSGTVPEMQSAQERADFVMKNLGPLWYRGYFPEQRDFPAATMEDIDSIREQFSVRTIFVGHTIVPTVSSLYDGKVIAVQVYPKRDQQTGQVIFESLLIKDGVFFRAKPDGTTERLN
jgi:hypothetical protein